MARRKRRAGTADPKAADQAKAAEDALLRAYRRHVGDLGFTTVDEYQTWCRERGFGSARDKSVVVRSREHEQRKRELEDARLQASRRSRNPAAVLEAVCRGEVARDDLCRIPNRTLRDGAAAILARREDASLMATLIDVLPVVGERGRLVDGSTVTATGPTPYVAGVVRLCQRRGQWIRSIGDWRPKSKNRDRQFGHLVRHLLARYDVPRFMDSAWFTGIEGSHHYRDWFVMVATGASLRSARTPIPFTRKMWHHFMQAPGAYDVPQAIRWAQIHALGGRRHLTDAVIGTLLGRSFDHGPFWESVLRFFIAHPMLDRAHVLPIVDWLQHQRFQTREVVTGPGQVEQVAPPQPNLSMRGRTPESILDAVESWHRQLGRETARAKQFWPVSGIPPYEVTTGSSDANRATWRIRELLSTDALVAEGQAMGHCVATYAPSCAARRCSIWTMEVERRDGVLKLQTIEINSHNVIVQSRGKRNEEPNEQVLKLLARWADAADLGLATYL